MLWSLPPLSDVDAQWGKEMGVWRVNIGRKDVIEASAEEIEISRICVTWFVGHRTTAEADRGALFQVRVRLAPNDVHSHPHKQPGNSQEASSRGRDEIRVCSI